MEKEKQVKEKYLELQNLEQEVKRIQNQLAIVEQERANLEFGKNSLEGIKKVELGKEMLVELGSGCFIRGSIRDNKKVVMNVGAGVFVEKKIADAKEILEEQIRHINKVVKDISEELEIVNSRSLKVRNELNRLIEDVEDQ